MPRARACTPRTVPKLSQFRENRNSVWGDKIDSILGITIVSCEGREQGAVGSARCAAPSPPAAARAPSTRSPAPSHPPSRPLCLRQTNVSVCSSLGHPFLSQFNLVFLDMLQVYK